VYLTRFQTYKIAFPPKTKPRRGGGLRQINTCAAKSLYRSIVKKRRPLGFGVFIAIWSMGGRVEYCKYLEYLCTGLLTSNPGTGLEGGGRGRVPRPLAFTKKRQAGQEFLPEFLSFARSLYTVCTLYLDQVLVGRYINKI